MQPTLYGIQYEPAEKATVMDRLPFKLAKWLVFGSWYMEVRATTSGSVAPDPDYVGNSADHVPFYIGSVRHIAPKKGLTNLSFGQHVKKGTVLWRGHKVAGDHVFVDKLRWNLVPPKRGQIIVFDTDQIRGLQQKTHYIKRLVGMPGERISIDPPDLVVDGKALDGPESIRRIVKREPGYDGYRLVTGRTDGDPTSWALRQPSDYIDLSDEQYFACGDNTRNSKDGRYWGGVPEPNLVGPAVAVYWPFSKRWGAAR